ncbi:hypothetical protein ACNKHO_13700 [Shigella flexneri]
MCHVFHQDYIVKRGVHPHATERTNAGAAAHAVRNSRGHNVGHLYEAR